MPYLTRGYMVLLSLFVLSEFYFFYVSRVQNVSTNFNYLTSDTTVQLTNNFYYKGGAYMVAENIKIKDIIGVAPIVEEKTVTPSTKPEKWVMPTCLVMNQTFQGDFDDERSSKYYSIN